MLMGSIRNAILEEMVRRKLTIYQLSNMVREKVPQRTVYAFLTGEKDTGTETASVLMEALGLVIDNSPDKKAYSERSKIMESKDYAIRVFVDDDEGYLRWLKSSSSAYVVNSYRKPSADYLILHRTRCGSISSEKRTNWTTTGFIKICGDSKEELKRWALKEVGGALRSCGFCRP